MIRTHRKLSTQSRKLLITKQRRRYQYPIYDENQQVARTLGSRLAASRRSGCLNVGGVGSLQYCSIHDVTLPEKPLKPLAVCSSIGSPDTWLVDQESQQRILNIPWKFCQGEGPVGWV